MRSRIWGSSRMVSAKWPRWLVPNCSSKPSAVWASGTCMMPALLIRTSTGPRHDDAKARTDDRELRSRSRTSVSLAMPSATACPLAGLRTASTTCAPAWASASAVALPSPLVAPVTMIVLPVKSGRSAAFQFVTVMRDSLRRFGYAVVDGAPWHRHRAGRRDASDSWGDTKHRILVDDALEVDQWRPPVDRKEW